MQDLVRKKEGAITEESTLVLTGRPFQHLKMEKGGRIETVVK